MINMDEYISNLPCWHLLTQGHVVYIDRFEDGLFYGSFFNFASASKCESTVTLRQQTHFIETGVLKELPPEILAKHLLKTGGDVGIRP